MSALSSGKIDDQGRNIAFRTKQSYKQARFAYSPLGKALEKQKQLKIKEKNKTEALDGQVEKQLVALTEIDTSEKDDKKYLLFLKQEIFNEL